MCSHGYNEILNSRPCPTLFMSHPIGVKKMKSSNFLLLVAAVTSLAIVGCGGTSTGPDTKSDMSSENLTNVAYESATLCGKCGEMKGSETCCAEGAEVCSECDLHKGSTGCCKMKAGDDATLCGSCGEIKGTEACCAEGAETCSKCSLHKGAPGCCKLEKVEGAVEEEK